jgi:hypothetical protein
MGCWQGRGATSAAPHVVSARLSCDRLTAAQCAAAPAGTSARDRTRKGQVMAMIRICSADGCETKTLGDHCLEHELDRPVTQRSVRAELQHTAAPDDAIAAASSL